MEHKKMYCLEYKTGEIAAEFELFETFEEAENFGKGVKKPLFLFEAMFNPSDIFRNAQKGGAWDYDRHDVRFLDFKVLKDY